MLVDFTSIQFHLSFKLNYPEYLYYPQNPLEPGKNSCHQYIGKAGSPAFLKAVEMMKNRTKIEALQQVLHTLELGLEDLVDEANRINKNQKSENR